MRTLLRTHQQIVEKDFLPHDVQRTLHQIGDDSALSLGEAIEWLRAAFGLQATPQRIRQATEKYEWVAPLPRKKGARKHYSRDALTLLVVVLGLGDLGLSRQQIDDLMKGLEEYARLSPKAMAGNISENEKTRMELTVMKLRNVLSEAARLSRNKTRVAEVIGSICGQILEKIPKE